ncbi:MAG: hypothetical protein ISR49_02180 [Alphaproteobacteria bacterium]|nr:hypothetical protein [Alphaproteobacteria bacterium]
MAVTVVANLLLLGVVAYQLIAPVAPIAEPAVQPKSRVGVLAPLPSFEPPPPDRFAAINARAPFDPARHPVADATAARTTAAATLDLTLVGVVAGAGAAVAVLRRASGQTVSVRIGESVDGWRLASVTPGAVVFRTGATDYRLPLRAATGLAQSPLDNGSPPPSTDKPGQ